MQIDPIIPPLVLQLKHDHECNRRRKKCSSNFDDKIEQGKMLEDIILGSEAECLENELDVEVEINCMVV